MARPVVVGSDGSQESLQAVEWAAAEAVRHSAPLRIVTVAAPSCPADEEDQAARLDELMHTVYAQSLRTAARELARTVPGVIVETELLDGPPGRMLAHDSSTAQLLVVGAYGVGGYRQPGSAGRPGTWRRMLTAPLSWPGIRAAPFTTRSLSVSGI